MTLKNRSVSATRALILLGSVAVAAPVWAVPSIPTTGPLKMGTAYNPSNPGARGGEFEMTIQPGVIDLVFRTFCLEYNESISLNGNYVYSINPDSAINGGPRSGTVGVTYGSTLTPLGPGLSRDPISVGTAWLYSQFAQGTLPAVGGSGLYSTSLNQGVLQEAIWWLEGEKSPTFFSGSYNDGYGASNYYVTYALSQLGPAGLNLGVDNLAELRQDAGDFKADRFGTYVLNLTLSNGSVRQDVLWWERPSGGGQPVPDAGGTCVLLGAALSGLAFASRRAMVAPRQ